MKDILEPPPRGMINGWWPVYEDTVLSDWVREGTAVSLGNRYQILGVTSGNDNCIVRIHRVTTLAEYTDVIEAYRSLCRQFSGPEGPVFDLVCLFRGQSRDYYTGNGRVLLSPPPVAFRSTPLAHEYLSLLPETALAAEWSQWAQVIKDVTTLQDVSGSMYRLRDPYQPERKIAAERGDRTLSARLSTNPPLMALAMHYGFPTASLDVTPDPTVALWFALHATQRDESGLIRYIPNSGPPGTPDGPSVYVYIQFRDFEDWLSVDLSAVEALRGKAYRPFVQSAWGLPFHKLAQVWWGDMDPRFMRSLHPSERWPTAMVKPDFSADELLRARAMHEVAELFPPEDPLYQGLVAAKVARLAKYAI